MKQKFMNLWREFIPFLIAYVLLDIVVVGSLFVCSFEAKQADHVAWSDMGSIDFSTGLAKTN